MQNKCLGNKALLDKKDNNQIKIILEVAVEKFIFFF